MTTIRFFACSRRSITVDSICGHLCGKFAIRKDKKVNNAGTKSFAKNKNSKRRHSNNWSLLILRGVFGTKIRLAAVFSHPLAQLHHSNRLHRNSLIVSFSLVGKLNLNYCKLLSWLNWDCFWCRPWYWLDSLVINAFNAFMQANDSVRVAKKNSQ